MALRGRRFDLEFSCLFLLVSPTMKFHLISLATYLCCCSAMLAATQAATSETTKSLRAALVAQGVAEGAITGVDRHGIPALCGTQAGDPSAAKMKIAGASSPLALPSGTRSYEVIPSVVRSDGNDSFRLEVNANGPVSAVQLDV